MAANQMSAVHVQLNPEADSQDRMFEVTTRDNLVYYLIGFNLLFLSRKPKPSGRYWSGEISARSNQDNQREFEERAMKHIIAMVSRKTGSEMNTQPSNYHHGGSYVKLESEWRERLRHSKAKNNNANNK